MGVVVVRGVGVEVPRGVAVNVPLGVGVLVTDTDPVSVGVPLEPGNTRSSLPQPPARTTTAAVAAQSSATKARRFRLTRGLAERRSIAARSHRRGWGLLSQLLGDTHAIRVSTPHLQCL